MEHISLKSKKDPVDSPFSFKIMENHVSESTLNYYDWHWHNTIQFCLMTEESVTFHVNQKKYELQEGHALFINSKQLHRTYNEHGTRNAYLCFDFDPALISGYPGAGITSRFVTPYIQLNSLDSYLIQGELPWEKEILKHLNSIQKIYTSEDSEYRIWVLLHAIWSLLYYNLFSRTSPEVQQVNDRIRNLLLYIEKHFHEDIQLDELASEVHLSGSYLCRQFKQQMNCTIFEYITNYRLLRSVEMLEQGCSVTDAAYMCGFHTTSFYIKKFKEKTGVTPGKYISSSQSSI